MSRPVSSLTGPLPLRTLDTVATDIFAARATSLIVTILLTGYWPIFTPTRQICNRLHRGRQRQLAPMPRPRANPGIGAAFLRTLPSPLAPARRTFACEIPTYCPLHCPGL